MDDAPRQAEPADGLGPQPLELPSGERLVGVVDEAAGRQAVGDAAGGADEEHVGAGDGIGDGREQAGRVERLAQQQAVGPGIAFHVSLRSPAG